MSHPAGCDCPRCEEAVLLALAGDDLVASARAEVAEHERLAREATEPSAREHHERQVAYWRGRLAYLLREGGWS